VKKGAAAPSRYPSARQLIYGCGRDGRQDALAMPRPFSKRLPSAQSGPGFWTRCRPAKDYPEPKGASFWRRGLRSFPASPSGCRERPGSLPTVARAKVRWGESRAGLCESTGASSQALKRRVARWGS
jgi:hypothetical protein